MPSISLLNLLGMPRWLRWLALATAVAVVVTWLISTVGFLFVLAGLLWAATGLMFLRRIVPLTLIHMRGGQVALPRQPAAVTPAAPAPQPIAAAMPKPAIAPAAALAKGRTAIDALHGLDTVRGALEDLFASLKSAIASGRTGTLIILEGPAGIGKTTVADNLAHMLFGIGHVSRPEPYVVEADEALAINPAQWFDAISRVAAVADGCVLVFRHAGWMADKDGADAVARALARAADKRPGLTVVLTGATGLASRLTSGAVGKALLGRFSPHIIAFPNLDTSAVRAILSDLARTHDLRFDGGGDKKLAARLAELSIGEGFENAVTVHALFDDARVIAAKRAAALGKPLSVISAEDAEAAVELFDR